MSRKQIEANKIHSISSSSLQGSQVAARPALPAKPRTHTHLNQSQRPQFPSMRQTHIFAIPTAISTSKRPSRLLRLSTLPLLDGPPSPLPSARRSHHLRYPWRCSRHRDPRPQWPCEARPEPPPSTPKFPSARHLSPITTSIHHTNPHIHKNQKANTPRKHSQADDSAHSLPRGSRPAHHPPPRRKLPDPPRRGIKPRQTSQGSPSPQRRRHQRRRPIRPVRPPLSSNSHPLPHLTPSPGPRSMSSPTGRGSRPSGP